jgi:hypothetical protein
MIVDIQVVIVAPRSSLTKGLAQTFNFGKAAELPAA